MKTREEAINYLNEVDAAAGWIGKRLGGARIRVVQTKEKFGQARVYCSFGFWTFHEFLYPSYLWNKFPQWLIKVDYYVLGPITHQFGGLILPLQKWWYTRTYKKAIEKFPHLREAILTGADWPELLKGIVPDDRLFKDLDNNPSDY